MQLSPWDALSAPGACGVNANGGEKYWRFSPRNSAAKPRKCHCLFDKISSLWYIQNAISMTPRRKAVSYTALRLIPTGFPATLNNCPSGRFHISSYRVVSCRIVSYHTMLYIISIKCANQHKSFAVTVIWYIDFLVGGCVAQQWESHTGKIYINTKTWPIYENKRKTINSNSYIYIYTPYKHA